MRCFVFIIIIIMANQFSEEQRKAILISFNEIDKDADGKLSKQVFNYPSRKSHSSYAI